MLQSSQIRAARALLDWKQHDLAKAAKIGIATIRRIESKEGPMMGYVSTLVRIHLAFEKAGILFLDNDAAGGIGVRFVEPRH
jgi:transcriptional regulator with XRE-family HTH domain